MQKEYFTGVIITSIVIKDYKNFKKEEVLEDIGKTINIEFFNLLETEDSFILNIKEDLFCQNIPYFLAEQYKLMNINEIDYIREIKSLIKVLEVNDFQSYITYSKADENPLFRYINQSSGFAIVSNYNMSDNVSLEGIMYIPSPEISFIECYGPFVDTMTNLIHRSTGNPLARCVVFCNFYSCYMV